MRGQLSEIGEDGVVADQPVAGIEHALWQLEHQKDLKRRVVLYRRGPQFRASALWKIPTPVGYP